MLFSSCRIPCVACKGAVLLFGNEQGRCFAAQQCSCCSCIFIVMSRMNRFCGDSCFCAHGDTFWVCVNGLKVFNPCSWYPVACTATWYRQFLQGVAALTKHSQHSCGGNSQKLAAFLLLCVWLMVECLAVLSQYITTGGHCSLSCIKPFYNVWWWRCRHSSSSSNIWTLARYSMPLQWCRRGG